MLRLAAIDAAAVARLLAGYGLQMQLLPAATPIPASYWGESEAGLRGHTLYARPDTPLHSVLHESAHFICMSPRRRATMDRDAGGDDAEEAAVCYLQVLMAQQLPGVDREAMFRDMDAWGYSFRLGSTAAWFTQDAQDARDWLVHAGILDAGGALTGASRD